MRFALAPCLVVAVLSLASTVAIRNAVADAYAAEAANGLEAAIAESDKRGAPIEQPALHELADLAQSASRLAPQNASHLELLATLMMTPVANDGIVTQDAESANRVQRMAAVYLPASPYLWASLAILEDAIAVRRPASGLSRLEGALKNAAKFGPWEREVSGVIVDLGFANWDRWDIDTKTLVREAASRLAFRYPEDVMTVALKRGKVAVVCEVQRLGLRPECESRSAAPEVPVS